ncbi:Phosphoglycerate dehydrogenase or related dehydrogenase [Halanaeroarchaeum sp. HSR-CO]|uniref:hydroxyacid dehydrogenase n=1 Tax=Halanaeroarchaeum sp. HSR-CO TaxID=2866382 RepID=UPI00217DB879|nr:hydroxyacid dehydrogenase [Halanaeroarchaeum sp. HSR-CO]UWG46331.1 Phosphoglycerate dehydrogenase or related dehydrogenase [Halanaeroarchaeum sp. HSR-CO]
MTTALIDQDIQPTDLLIETLDAGIETTVGGDPDAAALIQSLKETDVLFTTSRLPVTRRVLTETDLEVVGKLGTGIDNVDLRAAEDLGIPVTYTPGINALSVAEHALGLTLAVLRRTPRLQEILEGGGWRDETPIGTELAEKTVGIIGFGNIGSRLAGLLQGFNVQLLIYDPYIQPEDTQILGGTRVDLDRLLQSADVVSVNASLTDETRGMIGADELSRMRDSAVLVNTARGPIVREDALAEALTTGEIAGAGLDVFETEPLSPASPLHELDSVVLTPHSGARTAEAAEATIERLAQNVNAILAGRDVPDRYLAVAGA